jgi:RNA polymerase sigma-70 factor (ECF subfamily)
MMTKEANETQFVKAYDQYLEAIFRFCFFRTNNRDLSKDLAQDTFMRAWHYIQMGNDVENIRALLYKIAGNTVVDWYRKRKNQSLETLMESGFDPIDTETVTDKQAEIESILTNVEKLSVEDRHLVVWHYVEGLTAGEIANTLKQNKNTVSVKLHRAVVKLRKLIHQ